MKSPATAVWGVMLVIGLGFGAAGCGGVPGEGARSGQAARDDVLKAVDLTRRTGSAKTLTKVVSVADGKQTVMQSVGVFDYRQNVGQLQLRLPGKGPVAGVITSRTLYVRGRPLSRPDRWRVFDLGAMGVGALLGGGLTDPSLGLELLRGVSEDVRRVGVEQFDGVRVAHYRGVLDVRHALSRASANSSAAHLGAAAAEDLSRLRIPFDAYLDDRGRVRQVVQVMTLRYAEGKSATITTTTRFSDFGTPVSVRVPGPADLRRQPDPARR
ncbi:hypothetical protein TH66_21910 [Carbonactinospora thermoautotrophica]|uniref:Lipoprotein n=1 Tax=Carbonactinospora thermoautotrophica TaxID=1469144 RepID=A0A132NHC2_9ACTN|nr:hypothetical protein [Carbonactinospora thermoautotrophica]KWW97991.1 hypothetical protein TH66_21910 [Carbonactinospora thermoautotrophica]KWX09535.1 hypothetical protein TR74_08995 [Carbonactinospora thermoautotrophica]